MMLRDRHGPVFSFMESLNPLEDCTHGESCIGFEQYWFPVRWSRTGSYDHMSSESYEESSGIEGLAHFSIVNPSSEVM